MDFSTPLTLESAPLRQNAFKMYFELHSSLATILRMKFDFKLPYFQQKNGFNRFVSYV